MYFMIYYICNVSWILYICCFVYFLVLIVMTFPNDFIERFCVLIYKLCDLLQD